MLSKFKRNGKAALSVVIDLRWQYDEVSNCGRNVKIYINYFVNYKIFLTYG